MPFPDWKDRIWEQEARKVVKKGEVIGDGCHFKDCFWRGYRHGDKCYLGLNSGLDLWEVEEEVMLQHCVDEPPPFQEEKIRMVTAFIEQVLQGHTFRELSPEVEKERTWIKDRYSELKGEHSFDESAEIARREWLERYLRKLGV